MKQILFFLYQYFTKPKTTSRSLSFDSLLDVQFVKNYDGDTVTVNVPYLHPLIGNKISIRVNGIDTPEIRGKCKEEKELAKEAKKIVYDILSNADRIDLRNVSRGKYFRIVADVLADGVSIAKVLLDKDLAVEYDGGTKSKDWCEK